MNYTLDQQLQPARFRPFPGTPLTDRELQILRLYAMYPQKEVARRLGVGLQSVKNHLDSAYRRLSVDRIVDAYRVLGWLVVPE